MHCHWLARRVTRRARQRAGTKSVQSGGGKVEENHTTKKTHGSDSCRDSVLCFPDVPYAKRKACDDYDRNVDIYIKKKHHPVTNGTSSKNGNGDSELRPTIVYLHGGAWILGDKDQFNSKSLCYHFAKHDYCAVSVGYRLTSISNRSITSAFVALTVLLALFGILSVSFHAKMALMGIWIVLVVVFIIIIMNRPRKTFRHPVHAMDCARSLHFVRKNIHKWGGDPNRIILVGHSAGAHLCALLCTNPRFLARVGMEPRDLLCGVCISGVYNDCANAPKSCGAATYSTNRLARIARRTRTRSRSTTYGPASSHLSSCSVHSATFR